MAREKSPKTSRSLRRMRVLAAVCVAAAMAVLLTWASTPAPAQDRVHSSEHHSFRVVTVVEGLSHPWGMAFLPGGDILVTERGGRLRVVRSGQLVPESVPGVPEVRARGQGGLLDVALHPRFEDNRQIYLCFSKPGQRGATTALVRGRFEEDRLTQVEEIFEADAWSTAGQHFGCRLLFDRGGYLYMTIGERGSKERAQDRSDHAGTTLRLHDDGRVPEDNPFVAEKGVRPEIYTFGNRNAQGMALHPETGEIWQNEHGPRGGDEINLIRAGRNYGWPTVTHGIGYDRSVISRRKEAPGIEPSLVVWVPSIAPSGMAFYTGDAFPRWKGHTFHGALAGQHLRRVAFDGTRATEQESLLEGLGRRIRDVRNGPDGFLYLLVDASSAPMLRLEPAGS
jgi:aldose sugar dehydrogenase